MKAIVTVKLNRPHIHHDPRNKQHGKCPLTPEGKYWSCTDITGSHHSYIEEGENRDEIRTKAEIKYGHITRIEVIPDA